MAPERLEQARTSASIALVFLFGVQMLRDLLAGMAFYVAGYLDAGIGETVAYSAAISLTALVAVPAALAFGTRRGAAVSGLVLALSRVAAQVVTDPGADLALNVIGVGAFAVFVALEVARLRGGGPATGMALATGVLGGLAADTALKGLPGSVDLSWHTGSAATATVMVLAAALAALLRPLLAARGAVGGNGRGRLAAIWPVTMLGPLLTLSLLDLQNVGQQTVSSGLGQPSALVLVCAANAIGLWIVAGRAVWHRRELTVAAVVLWAALFALSFRGESGAAAVGALLAGQAAVAVAVAVVFGAVTGEGGGASERTAVIVAAVAMALMMAAVVVLLGGYYGGEKLAYAIPRPWVLPLSAGWVGLAGVASLWMRRPGPRGGARMAHAPAGAGLAALVVGLIAWVAIPSPSPAPGTGFPVRVMTYNLHSGLDEQARPTLPAMARVIRESGADVVALQELSRGWATAGGADMLEYLGREAGMPHHVFGPTVDDMWGNAVISRYPIVESSVARLPEAPVTLYARNYVRAVIDIGAGERLTVIATHLTHVDDEGAVEARQAQAAALIAAWAGQPRSLVLGDLNAEPGDPDLESLRRAGLVDAMVSAGGPGPGYTSTARVPSRRIDTVWLSPDLFARELVTGTSRASDHLPVSVTVAPR